MDVFVQKLHHQGLGELQRNVRSAFAHRQVQPQRQRGGQGSSAHARIGQVAGNSVEVFVPKAQYADIKYGDRDNISIYNLNYTCTIDKGDDEFRLIFK